MSANTQTTMLHSTPYTSGAVRPRRAAGRPAITRLLAATTALIVAAIATGPAAAAVTVPQLQQGIRDYMNRKFKCTNLNVQVTPYADASLLQQGRVQQIVITVKKADMDGVIMNDLYLKATDVTVSLEALFKLGKLRTPLRKGAAIRATIKEDELNEAFSHAKIPIQQFALEFNNNNMVVATGVYKFIFGNKLKLEARLVPKKDGVHFVAQRAWVNGLPLPAGQVRALLAKMNPIINFADIPFQPDVKTIVIQKDTLTISG